MNTSPGIEKMEHTRYILKLLPFLIEKSHGTSRQLPKSLVMFSKYRLIAKKIYATIKITASFQCCQLPNIAKLEYCNQTTYVGYKNLILFRIPIFKQINYLKHIATAVIPIKYKTRQLQFKYNS